MKCAIFCLVALFEVATAQQSQPPQSPWDLSGTIRGEDGSVIVGAIVNLTELPPYLTKSRTRQWTAVSDATGGFKFQGLYRGRFQPCAQAPGTAWLDPCHWGIKTSTVTLVDQSATIQVAIVLKKGAAISVRVNDPGALLDRNELPASGAHLLLGLTDDTGSWEPATITSKDSAGRTFQAVIPFDRSTTLVAASSLFKLAGYAGTTLQSSGISSTATISATSGKVPPILTLTITGMAKP